MSNGPLAEEHLNQAVDLLSATTAVAVFYTLIFILYCLSFRLCYAQLRDDQGKINRRTVYTMAFQTVLLICATLDVVVSNRVAQITYIDSSAQHGTALAKLDNAVGSLEVFLILGVLAWRVWVVWSGTCLMMPLTVVSLIFYLINVGLWISYYVVKWNNNKVGLGGMFPVSMRLYIVVITCTVTNSVVMTLAIIGRLLFIRRKHIRVMGKSDTTSQYLGIVGTLIESYALDAVWCIGGVISFSTKYTPAANFFNDCGVQVDILTNFLLIYRVLSGRAWTRQTQDQLSTLRWSSNGAGSATAGTVDLPQPTIVEENPPVLSSWNNV